MIQEDKNEEHRPEEGVLGGTRGRGGGRVLPAQEIKARRPDGEKSRGTWKSRMAREVTG